MKKIPLHADELRIGYTQSGQGFSFTRFFTVATIVIIIIAALVIYFDLKAAKKLPSKNDSTK